MPKRRVEDFYNEGRAILARVEEGRMDSNPNRIAEGRDGGVFIFGLRNAVVAELETYTDPNQRRAGLLLTGRRQGSRQGELATASAYLNMPRVTGQRIRLDVLYDQTGSNAAVEAARLEIMPGRFKCLDEGRINEFRISFLLDHEEAKKQILALGEANVTPFAGQTLPEIPKSPTYIRNSLAPGETDFTLIESALSAINNNFAKR